MRRNMLIGVFALVLLFALTACDGRDQSVDDPSTPEPAAYSQRPTSSPDPAVSPDLGDSQEPDTSSDLEPDPLALDEGDELIFYHPNQSYSSWTSSLNLNSEDWVKMTQEEEEEYFGISFDLTDAVPDLAIAGHRFGRYENEYGVSYDVIGVWYESNDRHRTLNFWVGRKWKSIEFSDYYEAAKIPSSRMNGAEIKILSYTAEYWEVETEEGWEWYAEDELDRPEEAVYYSGPYYQAEFDCYGNHFSLQASGLTQEELGRILKHLTSAGGMGTEVPSPAPDSVRQPAESTAMEPDPLAPDEEDKLIFYYPEEGYGFYYGGGQTLTKDHVSMTWAELEEYLGVSLDLTDAVPDLVPRAQTMLGLYEDEDGIYNDANQLCYQSQGTHRMLDVLVGQVLDRGRIDTSWPWRVGGSYPVSRVNGVEITILSSPVEYWGLQTQAGWDAYAVDDPDRPEECVLCTKSHYMADFVYNGSHFSLQALDLTEEEFGRILKHFTTEYNGLQPD